jgi:nucleoside-diphosphate-sugar epimerase
MRVFVTGATGFIGSAIVEWLSAAGHEVTGLARSDASALRCERSGVTPLRGDVADTALLARAAIEHDAVIHAGFSHDDWNGMDAAFAQDEAAVGAMLDALRGSDKPFIYTSGSGVLADTGSAPVGEDAPLSPYPMLASRIRVEQAVLASAKHGVRGVVIRAGLVYGGGGGGTMRLLLDLAQRQGGPFTVGEGWNVWSAVHRDDLGELYRLALENAPAGRLYHAANDDRVTMREIAAAVARAAGRAVPIRALPVEDARAFAGGMADALVSEKRISAALARTELGCAPRGPSIIEEVERGSYAGQASAAEPASAGTVVTMINAFEVPVQVTDRFVSDWLTDLEFMRAQPGFISGTLYKAGLDQARFRFVNVAHWRDQESFQAAQAGILARFRAEGVDRVGAWRDAGVAMSAATFWAFKHF